MTSDLITLPAVNDSLAAMGSWSTGFGTELFLLAFALAGVLIAGLVIGKFGRASYATVAKAVGGGRKGGRRRR